MDNIVTISNVKQNVLEFDAEINGVDKNDMSVSFIISANGMNLGFEAKHQDGSKWEVEIPPLPMLERTAYPFKMDVTCDGYFFEPLQGTVNVVGSHDVYVSTPSTPHLPTIQKEETKIATLPQKATPKVTLESNGKKKAAPKSLSLLEKIVSPSMTKAAPIKSRVQKKSNPVDDIVKKILTKPTITEKVSNTITNVSAVKVTKIPKVAKSNKAIPVTEDIKPVIKVSEKDEKVKNMLKETQLDDQPEKDSQAINKIKKIN